MIASVKVFGCRGAEVSRDVGEVGGGGALLQRGGELPAVVDQRSD
jgi:hypothetical protein